MTRKEIKELAAAAEDLRIIDQQSATAREASEERRRKYLAMLCALEKRMDVLTANERAIVRLRFINGLSVEATARRVHYSERSVKRICQDALRKL